MGRLKSAQKGLKLKQGATDSSLNKKQSVKFSRVTMKERDKFRVPVYDYIL